MKVDILVLNYNGKNLLLKFLPSVLKAAAYSKHECRVSVVDNASVDGSPAFLKERFKDIGLFPVSKNDVLCSYNEVLKQIDSDVVILLNNDIETKEDFVDYLIEHFKDEDVFFVAPRLMNFDNSYNGGRSYLKFNFGILKAVVDTDNALVPGETVSIATGAFRRSMFLRLGGFDRLYLPGIWEDVDICYRAILLGKKGFYEPRSIIWHNESTTFKREYGEKAKLILAHRNMFLFFWKNIYDKGLIIKHILLCPPRIIYSIISGKKEFAMGFLAALAKLPEALSIRRANRIYMRLKKRQDRDIIR